MSVVLQSETPTPGVGVDELVGYWPVLVRIGWFLAGFLVVAVIGWFVVAPLLAGVVRRRNRNNPTIDEAVARYVRLLVVILAGLVGTGMAGYGYVVGDSALVVAALTLAVGVAGQTVIGSMVSGVVLVADPEFNVGDYIRWGDGEGTVRSITLRVTRVLTPSGELVTVPNTVLTGGSITRPFGHPRSRLVERVGLPYEIDVETAVDLLESTAAATDVVATAPSPKAYVEEFAADEIVVCVHYWIEGTAQTDVLSARSAYVEAVKRRLDAEQIEIGSVKEIELSGHVVVEGAGRSRSGEE